MNILLYLFLSTAAFPSESSQNFVMAKATFGIDPLTSLSIVPNDKKTVKSTLKVYKALSFVWTSDDFERRLGWKENDIFRGIICKLYDDAEKRTAPVCTVTDIISIESVGENEINLSEPLSLLLKEKIKKMPPYIHCHHEENFCTIKPAFIQTRPLLQ